MGAWSYADCLKILTSSSIASQRIGEDRRPLPAEPVSLYEYFAGTEAGCYCALKIGFLNLP